MYKNPETGNYEHDFRVPGIPRYHLSYGVARKADAEPLHETARALFKAKDLPVIKALRAGQVSLEQLTQLRLVGKPFSAALALAEVEAAWPTLGEAIAAYIEGIRQNRKRTDSTARQAETQLRRAAAYFGTDIPIDRITSASVTAYQSYLVGEKLATNTVTSYVWRVGALYHWFRRREERQAREEKRPTRTLHVPLDLETISTEKTHRVRFLSPDEAERLLAATPGPLLLPIAVGLFAGVRVDEMIHLRTAFDVDLEMGLLAVQVQPTWRPKTANSVRHIPISTALRPILDHHLAHYASEEWVTPAFRDPGRPLNMYTFLEHFARLVRNAELIPGQKDPNGVTYHVLRHTFASWLLMRGADVYTVAKLLGNSPRQVEKVYGHLSKDHRQQAVDRLSGAITTPVLSAPETAEKAQKSATRNATTNPENTQC